MVKVKYKKYCLFNMCHIWFSKLGNVDERSDIIFIHGYDSDDRIFKNYRYVNKIARNTLLIDLNQSEEEMWNKLNRTTRREIRRAQEMELRIVFYDGKDMPYEYLKNFKESYDAMHKSKGTRGRFNAKLMSQYTEKDAVIYSVAMYNGKPLVYHSYIVDDENVRAMHSVSTQRDNKELQATIGKVNRYLHWQDILYFKEWGRKTYDWGGFTNFANPNSIDMFKLGFGGAPKMYSDIIIGSSRLGSWFLKFRHRK